MITRLALLPHHLREAARALPDASSLIRYKMPRTRHVCAGVMLSVLAHSGIIFGLNGRPVVDKLRDPAPRRPIGGIVDLPPTTPRAPEVSNADPAKAPPPPTRNDYYSRLPERPDGAAGDGAIRFTLATFDTWVPPGVGGGIAGLPDGAATPGVFDRVGDGILGEVDLDERAAPTFRGAPRYPFEERHAGRTGIVVLRFVVTRRGDVRDVETLSATSPAFAREASEAVAKWKFKAGRKDGRSVDSRMEIPIRFLLEEGA